MTAPKTIIRKGKLVKRARELANQVFDELIKAPDLNTAHVRFDFHVAKGGIGNAYKSFPTNDQKEQI